MNIASYWNERYQENLSYGNVLLQPVQRLALYKKKGSVLDLGCGTGLATFYLAEKGFHVDANDISDVAVAHVKKIAHEKKLDSFISVESCSIADILKRKKKFDIILCTSVLHIQKRKDAYLYLKQMVEKTKKGGIHVIAAITKQGDFFKMKHNKERFYIEELELFNYYKKQGWEILEFHLAWGTSAQKDSKNRSYRNKTVIITAQKP